MSYMYDQFTSQSLCSHWTVLRCGLQLLPLFAQEYVNMDRHTLKHIGAGLFPLARPRESPASASPCLVAVIYTV